MDRRDRRERGRPKRFLNVRLCHLNRRPQRGTASCVAGRRCGTYRVEITGEPSYAMDICLTSSLGDHNRATVSEAAGRIVKAIPSVIAAPPGIRTTLNLPVTSGVNLFGRQATPVDGYPKPTANPGYGPPLTYCDKHTARRTLLPTLQLRIAV